MDVIGKKWILREFEVASRTIEIPSESIVDLKIGDTRLAGWTGCNRYFASYYELQDGIVRIGALGSTKAFCEGIMHFERAYMESLEKVTMMKMEGEDLILCSLGDEVKLTYRLA